MRKLVGYILSPIFYIFFGLWLVIFHPIQWICFKIFGYKAHKISVDCLNFFLTYSQFILFNSTKFRGRDHLKKGTPKLFIANHQSMFDIPSLIWFLRDHHVKFISKIELTKGIPSISFNLKYGGGANIDRNDRKQAISEIIKLGKKMHDKNWSSVIFAEGTRARDGKMKPFQIGGIATLLKIVPEAEIIPIAIENSWKIVRFGSFPLGTGLSLKWTVLPPIERSDKTPEEIVAEVEQAIRLHNHQPINN